jgi:hypothetical protein
LLDEAREGLRARHYAFRTEQSSIDWMRRCILFPQKRHPREPAYLTPGLEGIRTRNTSAVQVWHPGGYQTNPEGATHEQFTSMMTVSSGWRSTRPTQKEPPMSSSQEVYTRIAEKLQRVHPNLHWRRLSPWIWFIVGLIHGPSVHRSQLALHIPVGGAIPGRMARLRRWLANDAIEPRTLYDPLIREVLQPWRHREVTTMLDGCFIRHKTLQMLRLSPSPCFRALPLAWEVVTSKGHVATEVCARMLRSVAELLQPTRRVTLLADRGFRGREWANWRTTIFPTHALAQEAEMALADYAEFLFRAGKLHVPDPVAAWRAIEQLHARLIAFLSTRKTLRIVAPGTDLTCGVAGRTWISCAGEKNC